MPILILVFDQNSIATARSSRIDRQIRRSTSRLSLLTDPNRLGLRFDCFKNSRFIGGTPSGRLSTACALLPHVHDKHPGHCYGLFARLVPRIAGDMPE